MEPNVTTHSVHTESCHGYSGISWSGIVAGGLTAIGLSFLFALLNTGVGLSLFTTDTEGLRQMVVGGFIWLLICGIISMFLAGLVAGWVASVWGSPCVGVLHGFLAWCFALFIALMLATNVNLFIPTGKDYVASPYQSTQSLSNTTVKATDSMLSTKQNKENQKVTTETNEEAVNKVGIGGLGVFFIFFIGAIASCLGGWAGSHCHRRHTHDHTHTPVV